MIHVYPKNDWIEHEVEGTMCICEPRIDWELGIVIHNSADGRESQEKADGLPK
jgi:hypothetical protein